MSETIAIIPARSGSKSVPEKNIALLGGRPLIAYSIKAAILAKNIDRVIVSTDSERYAKIAREYGAEVPFMRPVEISGDMSTDFEFFKHTLDWFLDSEGAIPKYMVHLRPTTPLRDKHMIETAIEAIKESNCATALRSVHEMTESAFKAFELEDGYLKSLGSGSFHLDDANKPRQAFKTTYEANGYVDVIQSNYVLEKRRIHGDRVLAYVTPFIAEVDTPEDLDYLRFQVENKSELVERLFGGPVPVKSG